MSAEAKKEEEKRAKARQKRKARKAKSSASKQQKARKKEEAKTVIKMAKHKPSLFKKPVPLEVDIHKKLLADPDLPVSKRKLRGFLYWWCNRPEYVKLIKAGDERVSLDD